MSTFPSSKELADATTVVLIVDGKTKVIKEALAHERGEVE